MLILFSDQIESRLLKQESTSQNQPRTADNGTHALSQALTLIATELPQLANRTRDQSEPLHHDAERSSKRRRVDIIKDSVNAQDLSDQQPPLPAPQAIDIIVTTYFSHIHPWIPMLHLDIFPRRLKTGEGLRRLQVVLHAMSLAVEHHIPQTGEGAVQSIFSSHWPADRVRTWVVMTALRSVALEGLQALIIVAFHDVRLRGYITNVPQDLTDVLSPLDRQRKRFSSVVTRCIPQQNC